MKYIYLILLLPFIAYSQGADTCSISGTLYDVYGRVLANAEVKIKEVRKSGYVISATEVTKYASPQGVVQFPLPRTSGTDTVKARIYINAYPWNRNSSTGVWVAIPNAATATLASLTTTTYIPPTVAVTVTGLYSSGTLGQVWKTLAGGVQGWAADSAGGAGRTYLNAGLNILVDSTGALYTVRHKTDSLHITKVQRDKIEGAANGDSVSTALAAKRNIADTTKPAGTVTWAQVRVEVKDSLNGVVRSESDPLAVKKADSASYALGYVTKKSQTDTLNANVVRTESDPVYAAAAAGLRLKSDTTKPAGTVTWTQARIEVKDTLDKAFTDTTGRNLAVQNISAGGGTNAQVLTNIGGAHVAWRDAGGVPDSVLQNWYRVTGTNWLRPVAKNGTDVVAVDTLFGSHVNVNGSVIATTGTSSQGTHIVGGSGVRYTSYTGINTNAIYLSAASTGSDLFASLVGGSATSNMYMYWNSSGSVNTRGSIYAGAPDGAAVAAGGSARLHVRGSGTTSGTTALLVQNSTPSELFKLLDNGAWNINGDGVVNGITATVGRVDSLVRDTTNRVVRDTLYTRIIRHDLPVGVNIGAGGGFKLGTITYEVISPTNRSHVRIIADSTNNVQLDAVSMQIRYKCLGDCGLTAPRTNSTTIGEITWTGNAPFINTWFHSVGTAGGVAVEWANTQAYSWLLRIASTNYTDAFKMHIRIDYILPAANTSTNPVLFGD